MPLEGVKHRRLRKYEVSNAKHVHAIFCRDFSPFSFSFLLSSPTDTFYFDKLFLPFVMAQNRFHFKKSLQTHETRKNPHNHSWLKRAVEPKRGFLTGINDISLAYSFHFLQRDFFFSLSLSVRGFTRMRLQLPKTICDFCTGYCCCIANAVRKRRRKFSSSI